ncbi:MAG: hypothetical protein ABW068_11835, partial [Candidatus Thiodiazotropha sp.]
GSKPVPDINHKMPCKWGGDHIRVQRSGTRERTPELWLSRVPLRCTRATWVAGSPGWVLGYQCVREGFKQIR